MVPKPDRAGRPWSPARAALAAMAAACLTLSASAQPTGAAPPGVLPCTMAAQQSLTAADEQRIREYIQEHARPLAGGDAEAGSRARTALMSPLACAEVSVTFRLKYGELLEPALRPMIAGADERIAVNAMLVLGRVKTAPASRPLLPALASPNPVLRFGAASSLRDTLSQVATDSFGFRDSDLDQILDALGTALAGEKDAAVADALVLALGDATKASQPIQGRAMLRLTDAVAQRLRSLRAETVSNEQGWARVVYRTLDLSRRALFTQAAGTVDREFARRAALLSGQVFAFGRDALRAGRAPSDPLLPDLMSAAEGLAVIAHNALAPGDRIAERNLKSVFEGAAARGDAAPFTAAVEGWIGPAGVLLKAPYNARAADFAPAGG